MMHVKEAPSPLSAPQVRDLQHKVHALESQLQEVESLKQRLVAEQHLATEWKERWNFQVGAGVAVDVF
jgi:hypothetical protein